MGDEKHADIDCYSHPLRVSAWFSWAMGHFDDMSTEPYLASRKTCLDCPRNQCRIPNLGGVVDVDEISQSSNTFALALERHRHGRHFLFERFGSNGRQIARQNPWHFRHSLMTVHYSTVILGLVRMGGREGLLLVLHLVIQYETFWLLYRQSEAAFGHLKSTKRLSLDYRHKPRFAQAALFQLIIFGLNISLVSKQHPIADYLLVALPITALATLLLYINRGHKVNFINPCPTIYGTPHDRLCEICTLAMTTTGADSGDSRRRHHANKKSLQQSAQRGCRICAAVWQHASKIPEDFVQSLKIWESFTWIRNEGLRTIVCNGVDTEFEYRNDKGKLFSKHMQINWLNSDQYPIGGIHLTQALIYDNA
jgi:hypothetical protein